jgi:DNA-directed RNA polymerase II subunit RPB1
MKPSETLTFDKMTGGFVKKGEVCIETSGSNLVDVLCLPNIDTHKTFTNDINEIYHVLGIEAARQSLYNELQAVMWQKDMNSVNYRHMALLVDAMTSRGFLTSVNRHGIAKGDIGPLAKCSFERTTEMLIEAGVFSELDKINGVAANIMLGQIAPCGTGDSEILIDEKALAEQGHHIDIKTVVRTHASQDVVNTPILPQLPLYTPSSIEVPTQEVQEDDIIFV